MQALSPRLASVRVCRTTTGTSRNTGRRQHMKIMSVVGARPNFMKVGPIIRAIAKYNEEAQLAAARSEDPTVESVEHVLVHTGQHYDRRMSDSFFDDLGLPAPD